MGWTADKIMQRLEEAGYQALIVGGYVRDYLLGKTPKDADLATNAPYDESCKLFPGARLNLTGKAFQVLRVDGIELATFRCEYYSRPGKPEVWHTSSFTEDAARRDFTVNAIGMDLRGELYDPFNGQQDLQARLLRAVRDPHERFQEDPVRLLRGTELAVRLGFAIEDKTATAMKDMAASLATVPSERLVAELEKLMAAGSAAAVLRLYQQYGFLPWLLPELQHLAQAKIVPPHHHVDPWEHTLLVLEKVIELAPGDMALAIAALFHDGGKGINGYRRKGLTPEEKPRRWQKIYHEEISALRFQRAAARLPLGGKVATTAKLLIRWHNGRVVQSPLTAYHFLHRLVASGVKSREELVLLVEQLGVLLVGDCYGKTPELLQPHLTQVYQQLALLREGVARIPFYYKDAGINGKQYILLAQGSTVGDLMRRELSRLQLQAVEEWQKEVG